MSYAETGLAFSGFRQTQLLKLETLRELVTAASVKLVTLVGQKDGYAVMASIGMKQRALGTKGGDVRMFSSVDAAAKVQRDIGVQQFQIDLTGYESGRLRPGRPDTVRAAKQAAEAVAHSRWFHEEVSRTFDAVKRGDEPLLDSDVMWNEFTGTSEQLDETQRAGH